MKETLRRYYSLTKPGVTYGNAFSAIAGYLFAAGWQLPLGAFIAFTIGITLVIASACALNNLLDRDIDRLMERTRQRVSVTGGVKPLHGSLFAATLGTVGMILITIFTTPVAAWVAAFGFVTYVVLYGMTSKRLSMHGTLVGSISGAAPILAGYTAVTGHIDATGALLFAVLFFWQMPEFYSIAIYRQHEYAAAGIPVISVVKGRAITAAHIWWYTLAFVLSAIGLIFTGGTGIVYAFTMTILGAAWLRLGSEGLTTGGDPAWARRMFKFSLYILLVFCGLIALEAFLP